MQGGGTPAMAISPDHSIWITGYEVFLGPIPGLGADTTAFLMRLDPTGSQLRFFTDLGSSVQPVAIAVDPFGSAIITGNSRTSPFLIKFHAAGDIVFSRSFGGTMPAVTPSGRESNQPAIGVATDAASNIYVTGDTSMTDFPVTANAYQGAILAGCTYPAFANYAGVGGPFYTYFVSDVFLTKFSPDGNTLLYSTYLGGSCYDRPTSLAVTPDGIALIAGETNSQDFPQTNSSGTPPTVGQYESFVSVIDTNRSTLNFSSYLFAGSNPSVALSPDGTLHVAGSYGYLAQSQNASNPYAGLSATHAALFTIGAPTR